MSRIEDIDTGIWSEPDFEPLSAPASLLLIWSWTNPLCGMAGIYKVSRRRMSAEAKVALEQLDEVLSELAGARMLFYEDDVIWVRARVKRLRQKTPQIAKSIRRDVGKIAPAHPLRHAFLGEYSQASWLRDTLVTLTAPSGDPHGGVTSTIPSQIEGPSSERHSTLKGKGKGKGFKRGGSGGREDSDRWRAWAAEQLPDVPETFAVWAALALDGDGADVTAGAVLERIGRSYPHALRPVAVEVTA